VDELPSAETDVLDAVSIAPRVVERWTGEVRKHCGTDRRVVLERAALNADGTLTVYAEFSDDTAAHMDVHQAEWAWSRGSRQ
jgi:hypothetical protein